MLSPEDSSWITTLRARYAAGEEPAIDEMKRAIILLREGRASAADAAARSGKRAKAPTKDTDTLLGDFLG